MKQADISGPCFMLCSNNHDESGKAVVVGLLNFINFSFFVVTLDQNQKQSSMIS
jgi:hypothetical protein